MQNAKWIAAALTAGMFVTGAAGAAEQKRQAAAQPQTQKQEQPIGRVTASFGAGKIESGGKTRAADLHELFKSDDRIVTDGGGLSVLLATRVVLKIDANSAVRIAEGVGQTNVILEHGTVHIFVGKRSADMGLVALQDNNARVEGLNAVYLASYNPDTRESYYACEHSSVRLETKADGAATTLDNEKQVVVRDGKLVSNGDLDRVAFNDHKRSLDRLGENTIEQGTETFRLRSRTLDTEVALSQLSAAGWIDRQALSSAVAPSSGSSEEDDKANSKKGTGTAKIKSRAQTSAQVAAAEASSASSAQVASSSSAAPVASGGNAKAAPPSIPVAAAAKDSAPVDKVADAGNSGKGSKGDSGENKSAPASTVPPIAALPTPTDIGIDPSSNSGSGSLPQIDIDDSSGKGKNKRKGKGGRELVAVPVPVELKTPVADIGIAPSDAPVVPQAPIAALPPVTEVVAPPVVIAPIAPVIETPIAAPAAVPPPVSIDLPPTPVTPPIEIALPVTPVAPPVIDLPVAPAPVPAPTEIVPAPAAPVIPDLVDLPTPTDSLGVTPATAIPTPLPTPAEVSNSGPGSVTSGSGATPAAIPDVTPKPSKKSRRNR